MDKIPELVNRIERLEKEADLYYGEERESIENNIEKLTDELKKELTPYNEQLEQLEKNYNDRIARLEREAALYYGEAREPMDNNIEKLKIELKQEKDKILNQLEKQGVNLEKFGYREAKQEEINQEEEPTTPKEDVVMENPDIEEPQENVQAGVLGVRRAAFATMFAEMERGYEDLLQELPEEYFKRKEEILNSVNNNEMVHNLYMSYQKGEMTLPKVMNELMNKAIKENDFEKAVKAKRALEKIQARSIQNQQTVEEEQIEVGTQEAPTVNNNENETSIQVDTEESKNDKTQQRANQEDDKTEEKRLFEARKMLRAEIDRIKTESAQKYGYLGLGKYMRDTCNICLKISSTVTAEEIEKFTQRLKGKTILDVHRDNLEEIKASIEKAKANGKDESFIKKFEEFEKDTENIIQNLENIEKRDNEDKRTNPEEEQAKKEAEKERRFRRQELEFMFKNKEMRFEDLLAEPYINFKKDMFKLIDRDLDGAKKVMLEMHGMKLSDIYKIMLAKAQELGQKEKTEELLKYLEKVEQREIEIEKEAKEQTKKEEDLKKAAESRQRKEKSKQDEELKHEGEQHSKKKVMDKTTIDIDAKNNIIRIYKKGTSEPLYEVSDAEDIKTFINNGKEYKKDKEYRKEFGKKTLKKVDPAILGILVDIGNMELAEEYVNAFKNRNSNDIDIKYLFSNYTVGIPQKIVRNYIDSAKEAKKVKAVTVEGLSKGFMSMFKKWSNANQATMLESARMKEARMAKEDADANQPKGEKAKDKKAKKQSRFERFARRVLGDKGYEDTVKAAEEGKPKNEEKNSFKDEMSKDAPSPEKQAKTAQDFETQKGKREKRERKDRTTVEEVK